MFFADSEVPEYSFATVLDKRCAENDREQDWLTAYAESAYEIRRALKCIESKAERAEITEKSASEIKAEGKVYKCGVENVVENQFEQPQPKPFYISEVESYDCEATSYNRYEWEPYNPPYLWLPFWNHSNQHSHR